MEKKKFQFPHTYIIIFGVVLLAAVLTMFVPQGRFETTEVSYMIDGVEKTRTVVDPSSFEYVLDENGNKVTAVAPLFGTEDFGGQGILNFVFEGLTTGDKWGSAIGIIAFILVVGGAFGIVMRTGAIDAGILRIIQVLNGKEIMLIPILITIFSLGGAVFGDTCLTVLDLPKSINKIGGSILESEEICSRPLKIYLYKNSYADDYFKVYEPYYNDYEIIYK